MVNVMMLMQSQHSVGFWKLLLLLFSCLRNYSSMSFQCHCRQEVFTVPCWKRLPFFFLFFLSSPFFILGKRTRRCRNVHKVASRVQWILPFDDYVDVILSGSFILFKFVEPLHLQHK